MRFRFATDELRDLYTSEKGSEKVPLRVVKAFMRVVNAIDSVASELELRDFKGLHYEQLKGERGNRGEKSMRLGRQHRLIVTDEEDAGGKYLLLREIDSQHYKK